MSYEASAQWKDTPRAAFITRVFAQAISEFRAAVVNDGMEILHKGKNASQLDGFGLKSRLGNNLDNLCYSTSSAAGTSGSTLGSTILVISILTPTQALSGPRGSTVAIIDGALELALEAPWHHGSNH